MADFFTQFSCILDVGTAENAARADLIRGEFAVELDRHEGESLGFQMEVDHESGPGALRIHSDECGSPEHVIRFVLRCAGDLKLGGLWASPGAILVRNHGSTLLGAGRMKLVSPRQLAAVEAREARAAALIEQMQQAAES